jgi:hypothetical protein
MHVYIKVLSIECEMIRLSGIEKEAVVVRCTLLSQHLLGDTEEKCEIRNVTLGHEVTT